MKKEIVMNFNERLMDLRKSKGLSQDELGEKIGVSRQSISKWEVGTSYNDFTRLVILSDYYGITLDELVKGISVQEVRDKNKTEKEITDIYYNVEKGKIYLKWFFRILPFWMLFGMIIVLLFAYLNGGF